MAHRWLGLNSTGQTSVEFLFIFMIMLFYLEIVIQPNVRDASESIIAVNRIGQAKMNAMKLANAINEATALGGESSKSIWLFLGDNTSVWCDEAEKAIKYRADIGVSLAEEFNSCTDLADNKHECDGTIKVLDDTTLNCSNFSLKEGSKVPKARVRIYKIGSVTYVQDLLG